MTDRNWKKRICATLGALLLAAASPACADDLTIGIKTEPVLDPHYAWADANVAYYMHIYGGLTATNERLNVLPNLATSWEAISPTEWRFHLRQDAKFTDGTAVTAADVVASYNRMRTIKAVATFSGAIAGLKDVTAVDDYTVAITLEKPNPLVPQRVSLIQILPEELAGTDSGAFTDLSNVVGFGPYRPVSYTPGGTFVIERNPDYFGPPAKWDKVTFRIMTDPTARVAALLNGEVDLIDGVPPNLVDRLRNEEAVDVVVGPSSRTVSMLPDTARDKSPFITDAEGNPMDVNPLKDVRVRQALSLAIDRQAISQKVMNGLSFPTGQMTPEGFVGYSANIPVPVADPAKARALLAEAGYPNGFGMTIHCPSDKLIEGVNICQALGQMFTRVGVKTKVETMPGAVFTPRAMDKEGERFTMAMMGWSDGSGEALVLANVLHTPTATNGTWNWGGNSLPTLDALIDEASASMDRAVRTDRLGKAMELAMEQAVALPIHQQPVIVGVRKGFGYNTWVTEAMIADSASMMSN